MRDNGHVVKASTPTGTCDSGRGRRRDDADQQQHAAAAEITAAAAADDAIGSTAGAFDAETRRREVTAVGSGCMLN